MSCKSCHHNKDGQPGYFSIGEIGCYVKGATPRMVSGWIKNGLPCLRVNKKVVLVRREDLDRFLCAFNVSENSVDKILCETLREFK